MTHFLANDVLARLKEVSQEKKIEPAPKHCFLKANLSLVAEAKRVAQDIRERAGIRGVNYLIMCQGAYVSKYLPDTTSNSMTRHRWTTQWNIRTNARGN